MSYVRHNICCCVSMLLFWKYDLIVISIGLLLQLGLGVLYFECAIITSSSSSEHVHSYCAPLYPLQMSNIDTWQFSHFSSNILKLS